MSDGIVLPNGYTRLEYIEQPLGNSGYIKTGITPSKNLEFEIKAITYDTISNTIAQIGCLFGSRTSATYEYQLTTYIDSGATNKGTLRIGQTVYDANLTKNELFHALTSGNIYHHNSTEIQTVRDFNDESPAELYIFCFNVGDGGTDRPRQFGHGKIYYLKFFTGSTLIRDYVPCKNPNGVVGLYDLVTSAFFTSEDSAFVAGPIKTAYTFGIAQKLIELQEIKEDLRDAINEHYGTEELVYTDGLVDYADAIDGITGTQAVLPTEPKAVNFIDYDGTLLYAYTAEEFRANEGLPHNPFHSGLVAQGWNWTREEILDYLTRAERIDVGQNYITNDGATRYYIKKENPEYLEQFLHFYQGKSEGVLVNWGDGTSERFTGTGAKNVTHNYNSLGNYVISLLPDNDCEFRLTETVDSTTSRDVNRSTIFGPWKDVHYSLFRELYKVELGKNLISISSNAFRLCRNLKAISIPNTIYIFGPEAFVNCYALRAIVFPNVNGHRTDVRTYACNATGARYFCTNPNWAITFCGNYGFGNSTNIDYILIPDTVVQFASYSFQYNTLEKVYLSKNIIYLPTQTFSEGNYLKEIDLSHITTISDAFRSCWKLKYIKFSEGITSISANAFVGCYSVTEIDLPSTITTIGAMAFDACYNSRRIIIRATVPPTLNNVNAFNGAYITGSGGSTRSTGSGKAIFYVPYSEDHSVLQAYEESDATSSWGYYLTTNCEFKELNPDGTIPEEGGE